MVLQKGHITALQHLQMAEVGYRTKYRMFQATGLKKSSYICDLWLTCNKIQTPQGFSQSQHLIIFSTCFFLRFQKRWAPYWNLLIQQGSFSKVFKYLTAFRNQGSRDSPQHSLASHKHITPQLPSSHHHQAFTPSASDTNWGGHESAQHCQLLTVQIQTWSLTLRDLILLKLAVKTQIIKGWTKGNKEVAGLLKPYFPGKQLETICILISPLICMQRFR